MFSCKVQCSEAIAISGSGGEVGASLDRTSHTDYFACLDSLVQCFILKVSIQIDSRIKEQV